MKKILATLTLLLAIFPILTFADETEYKTLDLKEALAKEEIEVQFDESKYKDDDKKITIYLFRGDGCGYCRAFLTFLNSITDEYGKYFELESYQIFNDTKNSSLMTKVGNFMGDNVTGVPYIIIGDKTFPGYADTYDENIKTAIKDLYNSKERYDVFEEMEKAQEPATVDILPIILYNAAFTVISTGTILIIMNNKVKHLEEKLENINSKKKK